MRILAPAALLFVLLAGTALRGVAETAAPPPAATPAAAPVVAPTETVVLRVGDHGNMVRVVLECAKLTAYKVEKADSGLHVTLDARAAGKIAPWKNPILKKLSAAPGADGALRVDIGIPDGATFRDYRVNNKIVLDITAPAAATSQPAPAKPPVKAAAKKAPTTPISITPPKKEEPATPVPEKAAAPAPTEKSEAVKADTKTEAPASAPAAPATASTPPVPAAAGPEVAAAKVTPVETGPVLDDPEAIAGAKLPGDAPAALPSWNLSITRPDGGAPVEAPAATPPAPAPAVPADDSRSATVTVSSLVPLRVAVFTRFNALWIVTDAQGIDATPPQISGPMASFVTPSKVLKFKEGTAYRYTLPNKFYPVVEKQKLSWTVTLLSEPPPPGAAVLSANMKMQFDKATRQALMAVDLKGAGDPLSFEDPEIGDMLYVVPTSQPDQVVTEARQMIDFETLPAAAGLVVRPLKDELSVRHIMLKAKEKEAAGPDAPEAKDKEEGKEEKSGAEKSGEKTAEKAEKKTATAEEDVARKTGSNDFIVITAPGGLAVTPEGGGAIALIGAADEASDNDNNRLFDFPNWQKGGIRTFQKSREELQEKLSAAALPEERAGLLMSLAKLYFANNFGQEALGLLSLVQDENPEIVKNPDFMAIRGAANAMSGHYKEALEDLSFPAIQGRPEVNLWVGYAAAATEQWRMATRSFPKSNRLLLQYPDSIAIPFTVYMAESQLHLGHTDMALQLLDSINRDSAALDSQYKAAVDYLRGIAFSQKGEFDKAAALWEPVANGLDRLYHAKASLSLARLLLQQKKITLKEAIDRVDSLRFAWRGNGLEVSILHTLGALKAQDGQILAGLEDMKQAADLSDSLLDDSTPIRDDMKRIFTDVFLSDAAGKIPPLEMVSVYSEFNTLLPPGNEATLAALNLTDSLIRMDLLEKAAALMKDQLKNNLPQDKADALAIKLTAVYLLNKQPEEALAALRETERAGFGPKTAEERTLLKARAQSQLNQTAEAIATLATLNSKNAMKLKADVLWKAQKWAEAATAIESFLPDPAKPLTEEEASYVVNGAVAWKIAGDMDKLKEIKTRYAAPMAATRLGATFGVVTRDGGASTLADRETMMNIAGEVDMFKGFLDHYKAGVGQGS